MGVKDILRGVGMIKKRTAIIMVVLSIIFTASVTYVATTAMQVFDSISDTLVNQGTEDTQTTEKKLSNKKITIKEDEYNELKEMAERFNKLEMLEKYIDENFYQETDESVLDGIRRTAKKHRQHTDVAKGTFKKPEGDQNA